MTSVVLYSLTRATLMSPGKDETRVCGYIYIFSESLYIFYVLSTFNKVLIIWNIYCPCFKTWLVIYYIQKAANFNHLLTIIFYWIQPTFMFFIGWYIHIRATNLNRLLTIIFHWIQATFMFFLVDIYIHIYMIVITWKLKSK